MSTHTPRRLASALLVLLFLLVTGCDEHIVGVTPDEPLAADRSNASLAEAPDKFVILFSEAHTGLTFKAFGAIEDYGRVEGSPMPLNPRHAPGSAMGRRILMGRYGSLTLTYLVLMDEPGSLVGRFKIVDGTGAYEHLRGSGSFNVRIGASGTVTEVFNGLIGTPEAADDRFAGRLDPICLAKTTTPVSGQRVTLDLRGPGGIALRENTPDRSPLIFVALDGTTPYRVTANAPGYAGDPVFEIVFDDGPVSLPGGWLLHDTSAAHH